MKNLNSILAACALATLAGPAAAANQVSSAPTAVSAEQGTSFAVQISGSEFADVMLGGGLNFSWNPDVMDLSSVTVDAAVWEFARYGGLLDAAAGTLSGMYFASFQGRTGSFAIATLNFVADAPGSTPLAMSLFPSQPFANELGDVVAVTLGSTAVTVTAVPEPASWLLLALGGCALPLWRRRTAR